MKVQGRRKRGRPKRRWLDKVKDDILVGWMCMTGELHGGVCHRTSTPHKSGNKMKQKKKNNVGLIFMFVSSVVESLTSQSRSRVRIPFAAVSELGHFRSLHDAPVHSAEYLTIDGDGNVSE